MDGFISYPRTDNTVYPASLPVRELVTSLVKVKEFSAASGLLDGELKPTRGKKETTDHPPIYPTQAIQPGRPRGAEETGLRTGRAPLPRHLQPADDHRVDPRRHRGRLGDLLRPRLGRRRPRLRRHLHLRPLRRRGDPGAEGGPGALRPLDGRRPWIVDKETQPPSRISQGKLIELMEERGLGTKATRADIIQKLFDRGYVYGNPPIPTETGIALYEAFKNYVPADGDAGDDRPARGRDGPDRRRRDDQGRRSSARAATCCTRPGPRSTAATRTSPKSSGKGWTRTASSAPARSARKRAAPRRTARRTCCGSSARKNRANASSAAAAGPSTIPKSCDQTFPLPQRGDVFRLEERCSICDQTPRLKVVSPSAAAPGTSASTTTASRCRR